MGSIRCYWITGLPASGKTTLAKALLAQMNTDGVQAICLDGDELRKGLCSDLGLSESDRSENIRRAGEVAKLMTNAGIVVICAFVSPFRSDRRRVRALFDPIHFCEIHLNTSIGECVRRDPKGLYARAKSGQITGLTGWDAPYELPERAEFTFDTQVIGVDQMVFSVLERVCGNSSIAFGLRN